MRRLERRVSRLEQEAGHEMVFITYIGNPEPMSLTVADRRIYRLPGESWVEFTNRIEVSVSNQKLAIGDAVTSWNSSF
jgi:hypothetical protein